MRLQSAKQPAQAANAPRKAANPAAVDAAGINTSNQDALSTEPSALCRASLRAVQLFLGRSKLESIVRYRGIEVDGAVGGTVTDRDLIEVRQVLLGWLGGRSLALA